MKLRPPGLLIHAAILGWTSTWRIVRAGEENAERARRLSPHGGFATCFWHRSLAMAAAAHHHRKVAALISRSGDGAILSEHLERVGIRVVRGSSHRGAVQAVREMSLAIDEGWILATGCDGPKGPPRRAKAGMAEIARRHRVPLVPFGFACGRTWHLGTWDRMRVPWPGTRIAVAYGEPMVFPEAEPDEAGMAARLDAISAAIDACEARAARLIGVDPD